MLSISAPSDAKQAALPAPYRAVRALFLSMSQTFVLLRKSAIEYRHELCSGHLRKMYVQKLLAKSETS